MRLLVDGVFFQLAATGIARVWASLLPLLAARGDLEILVLDRGGLPGLPAAVTRLPFPRYTGPCPADSLLIQQICDQHRIEVFASSYYTTPLRVPAVQLVYDMIPELFGFDLSQRPWMEKETAIAFARRWLCISHSTRRDLLALYPELPPDRVEVAWCGVDRTVFTPRPAAEIAAFRAANGLERPYFLFVGSREQHRGYKNARLFFAALRDLPETGFDILCVGGEPGIDAGIRALLPEGVAVRLARLSDRELPLAYGGAEALVYPSLYEGFGMPVVEAMASGCPVITTLRGALAEAAGDAALAIGGESVAEMAAAIGRVRDPALRAGLRARGLAHAARFDWQPMADLLARQLHEARAEAAGGALDGFLAEWERLRRVQAEVDP